MVLVKVFIEIVMRLRIEIADVVHVNTFRRKFFVLFLGNLPHLLLSTTMITHDKDVLETVSRHAFDLGHIDSFEYFGWKRNTARRGFTESTRIHSKRR